MDPVGIILSTAVGLMLLYFILAAIKDHFEVKEHNEMVTSIRSLIKKEPQDAWDSEWLSAEDKRHRVTAIGHKKLYLFGDITKPVTEGFQWVCSCGGKGVGIDLKMADRNFQKHKKDEREKALAAIGRFK